MDEDGMLKVYNAAVALLEHVKQSYPEDFQDENAEYKCPYMQQLLRAVVNVCWEG